MKYVVMYRDECGDEHRAFGTPFLEGVHEFPAFDSDNGAMYAAFLTWQREIEEEAQRQWEEIFGPESRCFIERLFSDLSLLEWRALGYGDY